MDADQRPRPGGGAALLPGFVFLLEQLERLERDFRLALSCIMAKMLNSLWSAFGARKLRCDTSPFPRLPAISAGASGRKLVGEVVERRELGSARRSPRPSPSDRQSSQGWRRVLAERFSFLASDILVPYI